MVVLRVLVMRHGDRYQLTDGSGDPELTPAGHAQAAQIARLLLHEPIDAIFCKLPQFVI